MIATIDAIRTLRESHRIVTNVLRRRKTRGQSMLCVLVMMLAATTSDGSPIDDNGIVTADYSFNPIKGRGRPVCDAFLKRLRATKFVAPPNCGIPENSSVAGFSTLRRTPLTEDEVAELWPRVFWFTRTQSQLVDDPNWPASIARERLGRNLLAWRYDPPVSLGNTGAPDNIVIWQGPGADQGPMDTRCGEIFHVGDPPSGTVVEQLGFVLTQDNRRIDEERTRELFGHPLGAVGIASAAPTLASPRYAPLGYHEGVFQFNGVNYLEAFFQPGRGDLSGARAHDPAIGNTLAIIQQRSGRAEDVCEFRVTQKLIDRHSN